MKTNEKPVVATPAANDAAASASTSFRAGRADVHGSAAASTERDHDIAEPALSELILTPQLPDSRFWPDYDFVREPC